MARIPTSKKLEKIGISALEARRTISNKIDEQRDALKKKKISVNEAMESIKSEITKRGYLGILERYEPQFRVRKDKPTLFKMQEKDSGFSDEAFVSLLMCLSGFDPFPKNDTIARIIDIHSRSVTGRMNKLKNEKLYKGIIENIREMRKTRWGEVPTVKMEEILDHLTKNSEEHIKEIGMLIPTDHENKRAKFIHEKLIKRVSELCK